jgi:DNA-binding transcriptional LysR family regulator
VELTEAGQLLAAQVRLPMEDLEQAYQSVTDLAAGRRGSVSFAILPSGAFTVGTRSIARFGVDYPGVKVRQIEDPDRKLVERVLNREVDFGVGMFGRKEPALHFEQLYVDELVIVLPAEHPYARQKRITWAAFNESPTILLAAPQSSVRRLIDAGLAIAGFQRDPNFEVANMVTALEMVKEGLGITVLPRIALDSMRMDGLTLRYFSDPRPMRRVGLLWRVDRELSTAAKRLTEYLKEQSSPSQLSQPTAREVSRSLSPMLDV